MIVLSQTVSGDGRRQARAFALKTLDRLLYRSKCDGMMCHYFDGQPIMSGLLSDQIYFAQALIDAYQCSGIRRYLSEAEMLQTSLHPIFNMR